MKIRLALALFLSLLATTWSKQIPFYVGTFTGGTESKGIYLGSLDTETGQLGPVTLAGLAIDPSFLALSPDQQFLYSVQADNPSSVKAFRIGSSNELLPLNTQTCTGAGACHLVVDSTGQNVLVANYGSGEVVCLRRNSDGTLGSQSACVPASGHGPYASRQASPHAHSVNLDPSNKFVYVCDLGTDHIWMFRFQAETGGLTPTNPPFVKVPPGAGCRHMAQSADGRFVYVNNEMGMSVCTFSRDWVTGGLTLLQTVSMMPKGVPPEPNTSAEIICHPNGHFLYISNRTCDTISCFRITSDGSLDSLKNTPSLAKFPRSIAIDPTGKWLLAAGQKSNTIVSYQINPVTGDLTSTGQSVDSPAPVCILFPHSRSASTE